MAGTALRGRLTWQVANVSTVTAETASVLTITLDVPAWPAAAMPLAYACGPTSFVEAVSQALVQSGYPPQRVKTDATPASRPV